MSKRNNKPKVKKARWGLYFFFMFLYTALFLTGAVYGLKYLWNFLASYEASRPKIAIAAYMDNLTQEHICDMAMTVTQQIDGNLQTQEECRQIIEASLAEEITYAKKTSECTESRQVYVLRSGTDVIGEFVIEAGAADEFGFTPWTPVSESFDFSHLLWTDTVSITVPADHTVSVNGVELGSEYIVEENIRYEEVAEYYDDYDLPTKVTYEAGNFLGGPLEMTVTDPEGNPVTFDENTDWSQYYLNCSAEETEKLDAFVADFVERYVDFTGSNKNTRYAYFNKVIECVVPGSDLATRLQAAIDGLQFGQSQGDEVVSLVTHLQLRIEEGRYMCDVTYEVDTTGKEGVVRTTTNAKFIIVASETGLLLESMNIY